MTGGSMFKAANDDAPYVVFGSTDESYALANVLSLVCGPTCARDLSKSVEYVLKFMRVGQISSDNNRTIILHDPRRFLRPTRLIDTLYELRFSVRWLGPVLVVACPEVIDEIESTDLFRMSSDDHGPVPQRCIASPLLLGDLLTALSALDGYGRFAWKRVKQCVRDKDLIPPAHVLAKELTVCINDVRDMRQPLAQLRELLLERDGVLLRFLPGHGHLAAIDGLLMRDTLCFGASDVPTELQHILDALTALPKVTGGQHD